MARRNFRKKRMRRGKKRGKLSIEALMRPKRTVDIGAGIPRSVLVKLRYHDVRNLTGAITDSWVYRLNSLFDPDFTGTGHQPLWHDQLALLYNRYQVHGCYIRVRMVNLSASVPVEVVLFENDDSGYLQAHGAFEKGTNSSQVLSVQGSGRDTTTIQKYFDIRKLLASNLRDRDYSAVFGATPALEYFAILRVSSLDGSSTCSIQAQVDMVFLTHCWDQVDVSES